MAARFADVDTRRHVNNIAATLASRCSDFDADGGSSEEAVLLGIEQARAALLKAAFAAAGGQAERDGVRLRVAMFDVDTLQAMADCVMVYTDPAGPPGALPLPPALRAVLQSFHWIPGDTPCP